MESGINAGDQNFYARRQLPPSSPERIQHTQRTYSPSPHIEPELRSPQLPPKLPFLTTQNLQAATANGFIGGLGMGSGGGDPDEFYRDYRGVQQSANGYTDITTNTMPSATLDSRLGPSSLRSNGNGSTPKHPSLPTVNVTRSNPKASYRSASSPLDDRMTLGNSKSTSALNGYPNSRQQQQQPSVKDLLKRFDQNNEQPSAPARKPSPRIVTTNGGGNMRAQPGYQARSVSNATSTNSRTGSSSRDGGPGRVRSPPTTRTTQRTRFAAEDQHSNNTLSGVARAPRPRNIVPGTNSQASKSMTNLSPTTLAHTSQPPPSNSLFGEVTAAQEEFEIGHGIPRSVARRTSDSNLNPPSWIQERARLDDNIDPSSPTTDWYRGATTLDAAASRVPRSSLGHNRNHSDMPDTKVNTMNGVNPTFSTTAPTPTTPHESASRIPVKSNRFSGSSESSSVASTRGNSRTTSPSGRRSNLRLHNADKRPWSPAGRSTTPTNRSKTPTRARGSARNADMSSTSNASLKAYISAPPPKLSPPLRSSRPRQPVSSASTASSRQKVADRSGSPQQVRTGMKVTRTTGLEHQKSKKSPERVIDQGPVDFEAHRAKIKRAYTKSIHETEQAEIRMANMRRLHERQVRNSLAAAEKKMEDSVVEPVAPPPPVPEIIAPTPPPEPLYINTSFSPLKQNSSGLLPSQPVDSPTLGGVPGAFIDDDEPPQSAISNATEIENEPQTEAPRLSRMVSSQSIAPIMTSNQVFFSDDQFSPEQAMHGMSHNDDEIQIMLDATPVDVSQPELTPTNAEFARERDPSPPGAFEEDADLAEYRLPEFSEAARQSDVSPIQSSPATLMESGDEQSTQVEFPVHFDMRVAESPIVPDILYPDELISPTNVDPVEATRFGLSSLRTALAPSIHDAGQDNLMTPVTDFDYDSSDGIGGMNGSDQGHEAFLSGRDLQAPSASHRSSHLSGWTDYSVSTNDEYSGQEDYIEIGGPVVTPSDLQPERKPTPPPKESFIAVSPIVPPKPDGYSPVPSPRFQLTQSNLASPSYGQLSPLSNGEGFGLGFEERAPSIVSVTPLWPEYTPPLPPIVQPGDISPAPTRTPPPPNFYQKRPSSSLYQVSLNEGTRTTASRRTSGDASSSHMGASAQRSSTHGSLEEPAIPSTVQSNNTLETQSATAPAKTLDPKDAVEESEADKKTRKRLFKRRMVIKELIDTEAIYLKDMNVVEEIYKGTAEACPKLDTNDINTIFRNTAKIVAFSTKFLEELKSAGASVYSPRSKGRPGKTWTTSADGIDDRLSTATTLVEETDEQKDRKTFIGANFGKHLKDMQDIYTDYLKNSEIASARLHALQTDSAVKVWLGECNLVAKDLTQAWDIDALLVKPVQRITRYQLLLHEISETTPEDHPDYQALQVTCRELGALLKHIDDLKRRIQVVGRIVGRKRKESDVRTGLAKAFGRRSEKLQTSSNRPPDDEVYVKLHEKFGDDYLRLQVVMRDVEFYTRQCTTYVNDFLRYLSSMELVMRMSASPYPELESKWARFNMSMRDMGTVALEDHITSVRLKVIEPFEQVIRAYGPPGLAMKKRSKRRLDYEKSLTLTSKTKDPKLTELVDQYEALNETLKLELPKLSSLTETIGNIALIQFVNIQVQWYSIWQEKVRIVLEESQIPKDIEGIIDMFSRDYKYAEARAQELGIVNGNFDGGARARGSQSTQDDDSSIRTKSRPSNLSTRPRGQSITGDKSPSLPTPDFVKRNSGHFTFSPLMATSPGLPGSYGGPAYTQSHTRVGSGSPATPDPVSASRAYSTNVRPGTSRSHTSDAGVTRPSLDYNYSSRRESGYSASHHVDGPPSSTRPYSGLFNSALPDGPEDSQRSSRASSRDRCAGDSRFKVLYLAASLFEFNISATKSEAGYPYLTYQAGEIFDVLAEKGELWLAKNQDDPNDVVGWIWSKHFARLATD